MRKSILAATIAGGVLTVLSLSGGPAMAQEPQASWVADAGSSCIHVTGHVDIHVIVENTGNIPLQVTVTDLTFAGASASATIQPRQSHIFHLDAGQSPLPGGQVRVDVVFQGGSDSTIITHSPTRECGPGTTTPPVTTTTSTPPVTTTTTTPPVMTTTTQPGGGGGGTTTQPVAATTTQPVAATTTTHSPTVSPTSITSTRTKTTTATPVVAPTTVRPGGTAFTGVENVVPLGAIALVLMTGGSGLLWVSSRRRLQDMEDEE